MVWCVEALSAFEGNDGWQVTAADLALIELDDDSLATPTVHNEGDLVAVRAANVGDEVFFRDQDGVRQIHEVTSLAGFALVPDSGSFYQKWAYYDGLIVTKPKGSSSTLGFNETSGSPLIHLDADGLVLVGMVVSKNEPTNTNSHLSTLKIEELAGVKFLTKPAAKRERSFGRMPMLLADGLVADRWIIDN